MLNVTATKGLIYQKENSVELTSATTLKTHHVYSTLKRHRNHFHFVSTWNTHCMFVGRIANVSASEA